MDPGRQSGVDPRLPVASPRECPELQAEAGYSAAGNRVTYRDHSSRDTCGRERERGQLTAGDWRRLVAVTALQVTTAAALRLMALESWRARSLRSRTIVRLLVSGSDERLAWAIEATGRRLGRLSTCLVRALVAELVLDSTVEPVTLTIGVRRNMDGAFEAHAWVARCDRILVGVTGDEYVPIVTWTNGLRG